MLNLAEHDVIIFADCFNPTNAVVPMNKSKAADGHNGLWQRTHVLRATMVRVFP